MHGICGGRQGERALPAGAGSVARGALALRLGRRELTVLLLLVVRLCVAWCLTRLAVHVLAHGLIAYMHQGTFLTCLRGLTLHESTYRHLIRNRFDSIITMHQMSEVSNWLGLRTLDFLATTHDFGTSCAIAYLRLALERTTYIPVSLTVWNCGYRCEAARPSASRQPIATPSALAFCEDATCGAQGAPRCFRYTKRMPTPPQCQ